MKNPSQLIASILSSAFFLSLPVHAKECDDEIIVLKATESGSSKQNSAMNMVGVLQNRWIAEKGDEQWLQFEFLEPVVINKVRINWEGAFASDYDVQLGLKEGEWKEIHKVSNLKKLDRSPIHLSSPIKAKFLRLNCHKRALDYSYSIYDITINGKLLYEQYDQVKDTSYSDRSLTPEVRAKRVLDQMTFIEKQAYTTGFNNFFITPLKRFGLRSIYMTDASGGVHIRNQYPMEKSIAYPALIALAATWEPDLAHAYASSISAECRAQGSDVLLGPGLNLYRNSMCGRSFEYMGEDPHLVGLMSTQYVKGMQSNQILATAKHYIVNNHEWLRHNTNVIIDERTIRELYGRPWYRLAQEAKVGAIMGSYNLIDGHKVCESKYALTELLRDDIKYQGIVMSDWGAVWDGNKAAAAGLDLTMGAGEYKIPENPKELTKLKEQLDAMTLRILTTCFQFGFYDRERITESFRKDYAKYEAVALRAARRSITLLQNKNNTLPLVEATAKNIIVTGRAKTPYTGSGSGAVKGYDHKNVLTELEKTYGKDQITEIENPSDEELKKASAVIVRVRTEDGEHGDKLYQLNRQEDIDLLKRCTAIQPNTIVLFYSGRGSNMDDWGDKAGSIVHCYYPGQLGAQAIVEVLSGKLNPSGKLPFSIERKFSDSPAADYRPEGAGLSDQRKTDFDKKLPKLINAEYKEGVFIGYRWYEYQKIKPRFAFGHGLSYSHFDFGKPQVSVDQTIQLATTLTNKGTMDGAETVQVYFTAPDSGVNRPIKELCGFVKIDIPAGQSKQAKITIHPEDLAFYDIKRKLWVTPKGEYQLSIGSASNDIRQTVRFEIASEITFASPVPSPD